LRIGIHTSIASSLEGASTFQIFSASPRMWRAAPLDPDDIRAFDLAPLAIGADYLVIRRPDRQITRSSSRTPPAPARTSTSARAILEFQGFAASSVIPGCGAKPSCLKRPSRKKATIAGISTH
jgi:hypothetical protein